MTRSTLILRAFALATLLFICTLATEDVIVQQVLTLDSSSARNTCSVTKTKSHDALVQSTSDSTILLVGSSELEHSANREEHPTHSLDYTNVNVNLVGKAGFQSLSDAIMAGSIYDELSTTKPINLICSIQWYQCPGVSSSYFQYSFSIDHWYHFVNNEKISQETKERAYSRVMQLTNDNQAMQQQIILIWKASQGSLLCRVLEIPLLKIIHFDQYTHLLMEFFCLQSHETDVLEQPINWEEMRKNAVKTSRPKSDNNPFGFLNSYFNSDIKQRYEHGGFDDYYSSTTIKGCPEFDDLQLFLDITQEMGVPVNLYVISYSDAWAEYARFPQSELDAYYQGIEQIASKHTNTRVYTYTDQNKLKYFFQDKVHIGGLAWTYILPDLLNANGFGQFNPDNMRSKKSTPSNQ